MVMNDLCCHPNSKQLGRLIVPRPDERSLVRICLLLSVTKVPFLLGARSEP
jgi:hypothetical protein